MAKDDLSGKLVVILHADVVGSTQLVQQDEQLAHERIQDAFKRFSDAIRKHHGRVQELRGDALLAEFERASDAVTAAISFLSDHHDQLVKLNDEIQPGVRVGIALGEVVIADSTVTGAGVVLAQRIEQLAEPGGLCITSAIHEALPNRMPFTIESLGEQALKGFDDPVRVYRVELSPGESIPPPQQKRKQEPSQMRWIPMIAAALFMLMVIGGFTYWSKNAVPNEKPASVERMAFPLPDKPSIAVLPFTNMSNDEEQEFFVDGMTEDLITDISKVPGLFVIARNSVFTYKGKAVKVRQVAEELGVRYVLEGSVRRSGDQVRINAQLIDSTTGGHLWADRYDGSMADIFALQDTVTQQIASALQLNLTQRETAVTTKTINPKAYDAFLKGWAHYQRHTSNDLTKAVPYLEAAIRLDSEYAQAHAALAAVYWEAWDKHWAGALEISSSEAMKNAKAHLHQAMKQPGSLAHWVASNILIVEGNYQAAVTEAKQVVALDSNNAAGYAILAKALTLSGKANESAALIDKAVRLDPYFSPIHTAAQKGDVDAVRRLIADRVSIDAKDYYGKTPLHVAAENGHAEVAALLIEAGVDIDAKTKVIWNVVHAYTPLMLAARRGRRSVVELLITAGADEDARSHGIGEYNWTAFFLAVDSGHTGIAELFVARGTNIETTPDTPFGDNTGETVLFQAARKEHEAMVEFLLSKGANVNAVDTDASTPLHLAAISGNFDIVQLLLKNGADVNAKAAAVDYPGETPLHATAFSGHTQIAELLLANGADIDAPSQFGYTPLYRSIELGHQAMAEYLIKKGANMVARGPNGESMLHVIATTRHVTIAELLITGGADINAKDNSGFTPLDHAQGGDPKMIETLEQHGAKCTIC